MKPNRTIYFEDLKKEMNNPTSISLFAGCGGCALGLANAGYETRVMVEWSKDACATLRRNWTRKGWEEEGKGIGNICHAKWGTCNWHQKREPAIMQVDITKTSTEDILKAGDLKVGECFLLEGGFPCQGFSIAGPRMLNDPRNVLYKECVRVIKEALPRAFMLENVQGLISMGKGTIIKQICEDLAAVGYNVSWQKLNAADYGVPQNRVRVFFIGERVDVLVLKNKRPAFIMGGLPGKVTHPDFFIKKYKELFKK